MPATHFICPTGELTPILVCLESCPFAGQLPAGRCLSVRTLRLIADQRPWTGIPSTTQLLKGTREAFLELVTDYAFDPQGALWRVHGTKVHAAQDRHTGGNEFGEERLFGESNSGQFDFYDPETQTLFDTKTWGSYKIMRALGLHQVEVPEMENGEPVLFKSGPRKGQPRTKKEWRDGGVRDILDVAIQLNDYRMKVEEVLPRGYGVKRMVIEALARDGGTFIARSRAVEQNGILIPVNRISDRWIRRYLAAKSSALQHALETGEVPPPCKPRETWHGRKCKDYCDVRSHCAPLNTGDKIGRKAVLSG